ncbi:MAG: ORF6N domain-containing protein [Elusimicrobiota bacterium]|nr:ORF6N domain-containing protein [Elusimicrobiota bacterium]
MDTEGPVIKIKKGVFTARGQRVVAAADAAAFYEVTLHALLCAVARNPRKFTRQFMFRLTQREQAAVPALRRLSKPPLVFTETGVSMLSSVLKSGKAARISVEIVREVIRALKSLSLSAWDMLR